MNIDTFEAFQALFAKYRINAWGECVGLGWLPLVERLIQRLIELGWDRDLHQIKEKFGGLRFYIGDGTPEMHQAIDAAELESLRTCEICGAPGEPKGPGWILTLCEKHHEERNA